jgi:hypothetical protein
MPPFLLGSLFGFPRWIWGIGAVVVLIAAVLIGIKVHDHRVIAAHEAAQRAKDAQASLEAERRANALREAAAAQRQTDTLAVAKSERELIDAIKQVPDEKPDPVRVRLGCERLRRAGRINSDLPAVCRPAG